MLKSIEWLGRKVRFIDQSRLPLEELWIETDSPEVIAEAVRELKLRGAPLIGIAAAYAAALSALKFPGNDLKLFRSSLKTALCMLAATRPTAVNLSWALKRMEQAAEGAASTDEARKLLVKEAVEIQREDAEMCRLIGENGARLVPQNAAILTHCNTGALATGGSGTAQSVITTAQLQGKSIKVFADETRPLLQGARLTVWELKNAGVDVTLITDNTAAFLMKQKKVDLVVVGADRIAANGDAANKIGTYGLAVSARHHGVPFYIAAPFSTVDPATGSGDQIPIEERDPLEVTQGFARRTAPAGTKVYSPAFDVTPAPLITAIITDRGVFRPPYRFSGSGAGGEP